MNDVKSQVLRQHCENINNSGRKTGEAAGEPNSKAEKGTKYKKKKKEKRNQKKKKINF